MTMTATMRCSEPGHRAPVAIHASRGPGRWVVRPLHELFVSDLITWQIYKFSPALTFGRMTHVAPLPLRVIVFVTVGAGIVTGWLRPLYEHLVVDGGVLVPGWWIYLHIASLAVLLLLSAFLRRRHRRLCIVAWCGFWASLVPNAIPGFV
jgi:hypothetical protein